MGDVAPHGAATGRSRSHASRDLVPDEPIELRRNLDALRRARFFILALVVCSTAAAVGISLLVPKTYRATATLVLRETLDRSDEKHRSHAIPLNRYGSAITFNLHGVI